MAKDPDAVEEAADGGQEGQDDHDKASSEDASGRRYIGLVSRC
jgi:hypothetical protein